MDGGREGEKEGRKEKGMKKRKRKVYVLVSAVQRRNTSGKLTPTPLPYLAFLKCHVSLDVGDHDVASLSILCQPQQLSSCFDTVDVNYQAIHVLCSLPSSCSSFTHSSH